MKKPFITAHSGCEGTPAGSMESVTLALELGADFIEVDVRRAADGTLYLSHDACDPAGKLTLPDVFTAIKDTPLRINCDLKEQSTLYEVLSLAETYGFGPEKVTISGCTSPEQLARDISIVQRVSVALNIEEILKYLYIAEQLPEYDTRFSELMDHPWNLVSSMELTETRIINIIHYVKLLGVHSLNLPFRLLTDSLVAACREAGVPLSVWTVNDPEIQKRCVRTGVENITTTQVRMTLENRDVVYE